MNVPTNRTTENPSWPFRDPHNEGESSISVNQRLVGKLINRKMRYDALPPWQSGQLMALGKAISQNRSSKTRISMQQAASNCGLDPAFFAIAESGDALPEEITPAVIEALAVGSKAEVADLEIALSVKESSSSRNRAGQLVESIFSLCQSAFQNAVSSFKPDDNVKDSDGFSGLYADEKSGLSYSIGSIGGNKPPSIAFYEINRNNSPLINWVVSLRKGIVELASGTTDKRGVFSFPNHITRFPINSHMIITKPR